MSNETDKERISYLEKQVEELQKKLATAESPGIFLKVLVTLILAGSCFTIWKCRTFFKWAILALIAWILFGGTVTNIFDKSGKFISTTWAECKANSKVENEHEREIERMRAEVDAENSKTKVSSDAQISVARAIADADMAKVKAEADAKAQIMQAEEAVKQAEWERGQAERRNDAVNEAIRNGHWHSDTPVVKPEVTTPVSPEISKPQTEPMVTVNSENKTPKIERTVDGNTTRVIVRF